MQRRVKAGTQKIKLQDSDRPYLLNIASCDESSSTYEVCTTVFLLRLVLPQCTNKMLGNIMSFFYFNIAMREGRVGMDTK